MTQKYRWMTEEEFRNIKAGDSVICEIDGRMSRETVITGAFFNYDADEPGWEIETLNGAFTPDCLWVELVTPEQLAKRISNALEAELSRIYDEQGITSGDVTPDQYLTWERHTEALAELFAELIEQNKPL